MKSVSGEVFNVTIVHFKREEFESSYLSIKLRDQNDFTHKIKLGRLNGTTLPQIIFGKSTKMNISSEVDSEGVCVR